MVTMEFQTAADALEDRQGLVTLTTGAVELDKLLEGGMCMCLYIFILCVTYFCFDFACVDIAATDRILNLKLTPCILTTDCYDCQNRKCLRRPTKFFVNRKNI